MHIVGVILIPQKEILHFLDQLESNPGFPSCRAGGNSISVIIEHFLSIQDCQSFQGLIIVEVLRITSNYYMSSVHLYLLLRFPVFLYLPWNPRIWNQVRESGSPCTQVRPFSLRSCHLGSVTGQDKSLRCSLS